MHRQIYISIAKSMAVVTHTLGDVEKSKTLIIKLEGLVKGDKDGSDNQSDSVKLFAILTLGEIGRIYSQIYEMFKLKTP